MRPPGPLGWGVGAGVVALVAVGLVTAAHTHAADRPRARSAPAFKALVRPRPASPGAAPAAAAGPGAIGPGAVATGPGATSPGAGVPGPGAGVPVGAAPAGGGLWVADSDGAVTESVPGAPEHVSETTTTQPTVAIAADPAGGGYWLLGAGGEVSAVGTAHRWASFAAARLTQPVIGIVAAPGGLGYWVYTRGGRIFTGGRAHDYGSIPGYDPPSPVAAMVALPDGSGYWLAERDGQVLAYGAARSYGSPVHPRLTSPVVDMVSAPNGRGYWLLTRAGRVYAYGAARGYGSLAARDAPVVALVATAGGTGYWIVGDNGRIRRFGAAGPVASVASRGRSLVGDIVTLDPGHNGGNLTDPAYIDHLVPSGPGMEKACDTTGTETDGGYTEAAFNFDVVTRLAATLRADGAHVVLTRDNNTGVGPCVNQRAELGNQALSDVALSVHADGGPPGGRGFSILLPTLFHGYNNAVVPPSDRLGVVLRDTMAASRVLPISDYYGTDGLAVRSDLGGLNLSTVPKVLIEVGNMRDATDAALQVQPAFRQRVAGVLAHGLADFLLTTAP